MVESLTVVDAAYGDRRLAGLYDVLNPWGLGDSYYLELIRTASSVLDLGCGTGQLLKRVAAEGSSDVLVGVDVAEAMLTEAARTDATIDWRRGDVRTLTVGRRFEVVVMTGHAFQVLLTDDDVNAALSNVLRHLEPGGRFAFETRNPAARAWERWTPEQSRRRIETPSGESVEVAHGPAHTIEPDVVEFATTYRFDSASTPLVSTGALRFIDPAHLHELLARHGFRIDGWFGDWDRTAVTPSSPEVIVVAARPE